MLETQIGWLFRWFSESVDAVLRDKLLCDRAREAPLKRSAAFSTNLPACRRGLNKTCRVEALIRDERDTINSRLQPLSDKSEQLLRAMEVFRSVLDTPSRELSVGDCRRAGDSLIALEGIGSVTHALSTNATEWEPISHALGWEFVRIEYRDERSR
jgi:hypothetical protein